LAKPARHLILIALTAMVCIGQSASMMVNRDVKRVGLRLACLCGSCKNTVGDCQMIGCGYSSPARRKIAEMQAAGASDEQIIAKFVEEQGIRALAVPPARGFNVTVWLAPVAMLLIGLYAIYVYIRRFRQPSPVAAGVSARHRDLAARELADRE
jgi:cytochrome c-type biogenesis protein CcmH/NrfF